MNAFKDQRLGAFPVRIEVSQENKERKPRPSRFNRDGDGGGFRGSSDRRSSGGYKGNRDKGRKRFSH
jgi:hypothetical protein